MNLLDLDTPPLSPMLCLGNCGRHLTAPESRARGFGPECAEKLGLLEPRPPRFSKRDGGDCEGQGDLLEAAMSSVWTTEAGDKYHSTPDCRDLNAGHASGEAQGYEIRPIVKMELSEAAAKGKRPCGTCGGTP